MSSYSSSFLEGIIASSAPYVLPALLILIVLGTVLSFGYYYGDPAGETVLDRLSGMAHTIADAFRWLIDAIKNGFSNVVDAIKGYVSGLIPDIPSWDDIRNYINSLIPDWIPSWSDITDYIDDAVPSWTEIRAYVNSLIPGDIPTWTEITDYVDDTYDDLRSTVNNWIYMYLVAQVLDPFCDMWGYTWDYNEWIPGNLYNAAYDLVDSTIQSILGLSDSSWNWLKNNMEDAVDTLEDLV